MTDPVAPGIMMEKRERTGSNFVLNLGWVRAGSVEFGWSP